MEHVDTTVDNETDDILHIAKINTFAITESCSQFHIIHDQLLMFRGLQLTKTI